MRRSMSNLMYKKEYRELTSNAKLMYLFFEEVIFEEDEPKSVGESRTDISDPSAFIDEDGDMYCYFSNRELSFALNISEDEVRKCRLELIMIELIEEMKEHGSAINRIYLCRPIVTTTDRQDFKNEYHEMIANKRWNY